MIGSFKFTNRERTLIAANWKIFKFNCCCCHVWGCVLCQFDVYFVNEWHWFGWENSCFENHSNTKYLLWNIIQTHLKVTSNSNSNMNIEQYSQTISHQKPKHKSSCRKKVQCKNCTNWIVTHEMYAKKLQRRYLLHGKRFSVRNDFFFVFFLALLK